MQHEDFESSPDAYTVKLDAFEGPLDLLLYLIRRHSLDILDIPMAELTRQYMEYVEMMRATQLELAAEYLLMAALLIEIKSRMLLPVRRSDTGEEPEDPRAELVRRLLEYERMKLAAQRLDALPRVGRDFFLASAQAEVSLEQALPEVRAQDLRDAWAAILHRAQLNASHRITREQLSVRDHMSHILRRLSGVRFMEFTELFMERIASGDPAAVIVVHFLALLELARESLLEITQAAAYAPLYVRLTYTQSA
jgi:segregation and condensation protein A